MRRSGAEIVITLLERQGVRWVAGIPGGANLPLYDALGASGIGHVLARHEQGAGFIAEGIARVTGRAGVCFATSGPGATNLVTAIADARLDSVPLVAVTGQVPTTLIGTDAFQEVDTTGLTAPITKHNFLVRSGAELLDVVPLAFEIAESGRPGPVVIDVPKDVQQDVVDVGAWPAPGGKRPTPPCDRTAIERLAAMIGAARRPVLYVGGGVVAADASDELAALAHHASSPVTATLTGLGAFPAGDPLFLGMLGMHGAPHTNHALEEADLVVALGVRFDDRATGKVAAFCPRAAIAHVDVDAAEIGKLKPADLGIVGDVREALGALRPLVPRSRRPEWTARLAALRRRHPLRRGPSEPFAPLDFLERLASLVPADTIVSTDVGQHQMWVAQVWPFRRPRTLLTSAGLGTMGFGLPAAIGAALAEPRARVVCVSGDGSLLMNLQELATLADLDLDVTVVVLDNRHLGLVRQQQELFYGRRYLASRFASESDFAAIARGFGLRAIRLGRVDEPFVALERALAEPGPALVHVPIPEHANVLPMVPPGGANRDMIGAEPLEHADELGIRP